MECSTNIVTANFGGGKREATTAPLYEWDYGQVLCITGLDALPQTFEVHFAIQKKGGVSTTVVGIDGRVDIPNVLLTIGKDIHAWIYLSDSTGDGETEYAITIPVKERPMPEYYDAEVTGEFDGVVRQVGEYAEEATAAAERAATSATAAAQSATAAAASESAAAESAAAAETAAQDADTAKGQAETAAQTATEKAQQTAQDAAQAASDAGRAESAAQSAEAAQMGAENAKTDTETAAQGAAASASAASENATSAGQAATSAAQSATAAAGSATTAQGAAQTATTKAGEASASATAAAASATAAQTAQTAAEAAETNAGQSASTATAKAAEAVQSASGAAQSKTDAEAAATRAEQAAASLTVDSALSDSSTNPVQNKVITGELTDVKSAIDNTFFAFPVGVTSRYVVGSTGKIKGNTNWDYAEFDLTGLDGETLSLKTTLYNNFAAGWALFDTSGEYISGDTTATATVTLPQNVGKILISICKINLPLTYNDVSVACSFGKSVVRAGNFKGYFEGLVDDTLTKSGEAADAKETGDAIAELTEAVAEVEEATGISRQTVPKRTTQAVTYTEGYLDLSGEHHTSAAGTLHYTSAIEVSEGDVISTTGVKDSSFRFVTAYNGETAVSASGAENVFSYTVPSGITSVRVTLYKFYTGDVYRTRQEEILVQSNGVFGYFRATGDLSDGEALILPETNVNKNIRQAFTADITAFSGLLIGRKTGNNGCWVAIDGTNVTVYRDNVADTPVAHGLTIENNIQVRIVSKANISSPLDLYLVDITITSNGESFTMSNVSWVRTYNTPTAVSVGSTLTDCVLSWEAGDINKAIFAFGDSYFSWYTARWAYYCAQDGFADNALFNAYAGEASTAAVNSLLQLVPMGKPKYVVWCLGMNDGSDGESAPSSAWVTGRDAVINACKQYGATPIFATIPTVPGINHEQKNAWVRSSGYRYIDFAKAVGADSSGDWYSGMLSEDEVHPTAQGARALYGRVLTDFPEIMVSN